MKRTNKLHKIMSRIVDFLILHHLGYHTNKFKKGDIVTWNWKANIQLSSVVEREKGYFLVNKVIQHKEGASLEWVNGESGGDAFWYRKKYLWESL